MPNVNAVRTAVWWLGLARRADWTIFLFRKSLLQVEAGFFVDGRKTAHRGSTCAILQMRIILVCQMVRIMTLNQLIPSETATVVAIDLPFELRERLAALGIKSGRRLAVVHRLGTHGPLQVRAGSTDFILRPREAAGIKIRR